MVDLGLFVQFSEGSTVKFITIPVPCLSCSSN